MATARHRCPQFVSGGQYTRTITAAVTVAATAAVAAVTAIAAAVAAAAAAAAVPVMSKPFAPESTLLGALAEATCGIASFRVLASAPAARFLTHGAAVAAIAVAAIALAARAL